MEILSYMLIPFLNPELLALIAAASMAGVPPLNGFLSKELMLEEAAQRRDQSRVNNARCYRLPGAMPRGSPRHLHAWQAFARSAYFLTSQRSGVAPMMDGMNFRRHPEKPGLGEQTS